ncbi:MAG: HAMP domain-containing protein [Deltaproteobacteria bacterium]|nr:MAG: HAMP domain-containing protein [Deltaproteobacteria bacterium]
MKIQCSNCRREFKIVDPQKLDSSRKRIAFKCSECGNKQVLSKGEDESWSQYLDHRSSHSPLLSRDVQTPVRDRKAAVDEAAPVAVAKERSSLLDALPGEAPKRRSMFSGLTGQVILFMLLVSLLPLSIYAVILNYATIQRMEDETDQIGQQVTDGLIGQVNEWTDKNLRVLQAASQLPEMQSMNPASQEPILKAIAANYQWKYLVFTVNAAGMNIARNDGLPLTDYSDRQYYKNVVLEKKPFAWQTLIGRTTQKPALILAVPIKQGDRIVGALCSAMHVEAISDYIVNWRKGKTGFAFLVDQSGKAVAHQMEAFSQAEKNLNTHPLVANFKNGKVGMQRFLENDVPKIGFVRETKWNWKVVIQQDEDEVFALIRQANLFALVLLAATVFLVLVVATLSSRAIVRPIKKLTETAERISTGDLEVQIDVKSENEIGELAAAIGRMQDSIRIAIGRLKRTRSAKSLPKKSRPLSDSNADPSL